MGDIVFPIKTNEKVLFTLWDCEGNMSTVNMKVGECWYMDMRKPHRVINSLEMIGTFIGARLYATGHHNPDELRWTDFDIVTDNIGLIFFFVQSVLFGSSIQLDKT